MLILSDACLLLGPVARWVARAAWWSPVGCQRVSRQWGTAFVIAVLSLGVLPLVRGAEAGVVQAGIETPLLITDSAQFWTVPEGKKQTPHQVNLELRVHFYDHPWQVLWGESQGAPCFLPVAGAEMPIKPGQRVRLEGTVLPAVGFNGDSIKVTVLDDSSGPAPADTRGAIADHPKWDARWVSVEGYVCLQQEIDATHHWFEIVTEGRRVFARMMLGSTDPVPQLLHSRVRVKGVYVATPDPAGHLHRIDLWVSGPNNVEVIGHWDADPRFALKTTPIDRLASRPAAEWVRIQGQVRARVPAKSITIRDESGQITILTEQPDAVEIGETIEVIGSVKGEQWDVTLHDPIFRRPSASSSDAAAETARAPLLKLRLVEQVLELDPQEAARQYPVALRGAVTWADSTAGVFFIQDATGGIRLRLATGTTMPEIGGMVFATGYSSFGVFAPEVIAAQAVRVGEMALPPARVVTVEQAMTGAEEGRRVEIRGFLRQVEQDGPWTRLDLTTSGGEFSAFMAPEAGLEAHIGAWVRVTGVCVATANAQRQLTGVRLWLPGRDAIRIDEPPAADPFNAPVRTIAGLRQFHGANMAERRVRVAGAVLHQHPGRYLYLQDGDAGLLVLSRSREPLPAGAWVDVVGFPGREGNRLVLREAIWRPRAAGTPPAPLLIEPADALKRDHEGRLVQMRARLHQVIRERGGVRFVMSHEIGTFEAVFDWMPAELPTLGSLLELTGVHILDYDEARQPRTFRLHVRSAADIRVIEAASWWTAKRALAVACGLGLCSLLGIGWVAALRRRVRKQTEEIRAQHEKEVRLQAELERTARLESLGLLAGGIAHDFNNFLTVVMANISLATLDRRVAAAAGDVLGEAERGARRAAELTQQLLTFAKGGDPIRSAVALPEVVREAANFALHGSNVKCEVTTEPNLPAANVDRGQIGRVIHNLVLNATQAMPNGGTVRIGLSSVELAVGEVPTLGVGRYVKLTVADNGPGISAENLRRIFDPYFSTKPKNNGLGLATVHSIVKKHHGHIMVESAEGFGTVFHVWVPATTTTPQLQLPGLTSPVTRVRARVLLLDDEEPIRRSASAMLRQIGHETHAVATGAEAVELFQDAKSAGRPYDVVVLDLTVPGGMGGKTVLEILRACDPSVRAIVSSGYSSDPIMANYRAYGFAAAVPKPYGIAELGAAVGELMRDKTTAEVMIGSPR